MPSIEIRAQEEEILDTLESDPVMNARNYAFMARVNRWFGGFRTVRLLLARHLREGRPVRLLDLGAGSCDIAVSLCRWARGRGLRLSIDCLDRSPSAIAVGRSFLRRSGERDVRLIETDLWTFEPERPYDWAIGSMFFHHFGDSQVVGILRRLERFVRQGVLINDLERTRLHYTAGACATRLMPWEMRHDALLSIRRGFRVGELRRLLSNEGWRCDVRRRYLFRVAATIWFGEHDTLSHSEVARGGAEHASAAGGADRLSRDG